MPGVYLHSLRNGNICPRTNLIHQARTTDPIKPIQPIDWTTRSEGTQFIPPTTLYQTGQADSTRPTRPINQFDPNRPDSTRNGLHGWSDSPEWDGRTQPSITKVEMARLAGIFRWSQSDRAGLSQAGAVCWGYWGQVGSRSSSGLSSLSVWLVWPCQFGQLVQWMRHWLVRFSSRS